MSELVEHNKGFKSESQNEMQAEKAKNQTHTEFNDH